MGQTNEKNGEPVMQACPSSASRRFRSQSSYNGYRYLQDEFVHGTSLANLESILEKGLIAKTLGIALCEDYPRDGLIPGLNDAPEILVVLDKMKMLQKGIVLQQQDDGTYITKGQVKQGDDWVPNDGNSKGIIRPWFFKKILDNRPGNEGNVLFLSKDTWAKKTMETSPDPLPDRIIHATSVDNLSSIWSKGVVPLGLGHASGTGRKGHEELLLGAEDHVNAILPDYKGQKNIEIAGLENKPDVLITIDVKKAKELGVEVQQSSDRPDHFFVKGVLPPECLVGVHANSEVTHANIPKHLQAKLVTPNEAFEKLMVIDLSEPNEEELVKQIKWACSVPGFMQVVGHGISENLESKFLELQKKFFNLPQEVKNKIKTNDSSPVRGYFGRGDENLDGVLYGDANDRARVNNKEQDEVVARGTKKTDNKEGLDMNGVPWSKPGDSLVCRVFGMSSKFPDDELVPGLKETAEALSAEIFELSRRLLRLMALALERPPDFFESILTKPVATHRMLHYWPLQGNFQEQIGIGEHTDYGLLTILKQDDVGGLQVLSAADMQWVVVPPIEGAYIVNLGDMIARWSGNYFKSTIHRVVNMTNKDRYSSPFFLEPNLDTILRHGELEPKPKDQTAEEILAEFYTAAGLLKPPKKDKE